MGGTAQSKSDRTINCEQHPKEASAFCLSHKKSICMSCIVQKDHSDADCKLQEMEFVDDEVKECLRIKQLLTKFNSKLDVREIESKMKLEIEAAYSKALAKLEECKSLSYEVTRKEVAKKIEDNKQCYTRTLHGLDTAIDNYIAGDRIGGRVIKKDIMNKRFTTGFTFQKKIPSFDADKNFLVSVREEAKSPNSYLGNTEYQSERVNLPFKSHYDKSPNRYLFNTERVNLPFKSRYDSGAPNDDVNAKRSGYNLYSYKFHTHHK